MKIVNYTLRFVILSLTILALNSCTGGFIRVNRMEGFAKQKENIDKIIYIAPQSFVYQNRDFEKLDKKLSEKLQKSLDNELLKLAENKSNKMNLVLIPDASKGIKEDYLRYLVPLKNDILLHVQMQDNPLNFASRKDRKRISKQVFVVPIKLNPEWSKLSTIYGTPYFGFIGSFSGGTKTVLVNYVLDVNKGELIYQSISAATGRIKGIALSHLVYDSVYLMNHSK